MPMRKPSLCTENGTLASTESGCNGLALCWRSIRSGLALWLHCWCVTIMLLNKWSGFHLQVPIQAYWMVCVDVLGMASSFPMTPAMRNRQIGPEYKLHHCCLRSSHYKHNHRLGLPPYSWGAGERKGVWQLKEKALCHLRQSAANVQERLRFKENYIMKALLDNSVIRGRLR
jgi:hypothetical protein